MVWQVKDGKTTTILREKDHYEERHKRDHGSPEETFSFLFKTACSRCYSYKAKKTPGTQRLRHK